MITIASPLYLKNAGNHPLLAPDMFADMPPELKQQMMDPNTPPNVKATIRRDWLQSKGKKDQVSPYAGYLTWKNPHNANPDWMKNPPKIKL